VDPSSHDATLGELSRDECFRLLESQAVGRLVVIEDHRPLVFPVNYVLDGDAVVIRTASGTKLYGATRGFVSFEVDDLHTDNRTGWSVVLTGVAQEVTDLDRPDLVERLGAVPLEPWAPGDRPALVRLAAETVTGRRITRA
jgi:nitroimidazol reductase NimA-like FMN-containing flavoprotein (pyridoxamine 5'-phosphate oxidase superfamily)